MAKFKVAHNIDVVKYLDSLRLIYVKILTNLQVLFRLINKKKGTKWAI